MPKDNTTDSYSEGDVLTPCYFSADFYQKRKKGKYRLVKAPRVAGPVADTHCHIEMLQRPYWAFIRAALHNVGFLACVIDSVDDGQAGFDIVNEAYFKAKEELPKVVEQIKNAGNDYVCDSSGSNDQCSPNPGEQITIHAGDEPQLCLDIDSVCDNPKIPELRYIVGCHPHYAKDFDASAEAQLETLLKNPRVACVGEIGLDYHYDLSPRDTQVEVFKRQIAIAKEAHLPIALHLREAHDTALQVFDEVGFNEYGTLLHCFNLGSEELKPWVEAGCYVALGGPLTFKKSDDTRAAVSLIPKDRILTETDAPFMTPEPVRGDTCFPDHVIFNAEMLAKVVGCDDSKSKQMFYSQLMENTHEFFSIV